ncbi:HtrA protease/chaperone protein, partial [hydrothermal vent metagenome]
GRDFFGRRVRQQSSGLGSGVIVSEDGYILTNNHVVEGATELLVKLSDGRTVEGKLIGGDSLRDIAVIKVKARGLTPAEFGESVSLEVGEWVLAVGSPFGFDQTVTAGIVSAKGRGLGIMNRDYKDAEDFIQTDAAINPGNSGGPLINLDGEVVGINSAIFSRSGGSVGLGFSIPVELALAVYENIVAGGSVDFGWLGVELAEGAKVARVLDESPASLAGLRKGDRVIRYRGREVTDSGQLIRSIQFTPPGSEAVVVVLRKGKRVELVARVASRTEAEVARYGGRVIRSLGVTVITATEEALGTGSGTDGLGVFVVAVEDGGIMAQAGFQRGDIILEVDGERVRSVEGFVEKLAEGGRSVRIDLQRGEVRGFTTLRR